MTRRSTLLASLLACWCVPAVAQQATYSSLYTPLTTADVAAARGVLPTAYTVATLPDPAQNQGKYAFVTDLGGGPDMVLSDGTYWKNIRQGVTTDVPGGKAITITPLVSPPIMRVTGTSLASTSVTIATANLYPGATFRILIPGTLASLATFGVHVDGNGTTVGQLGGTWQDLQWNGSQLVKIAGGSL